MVRSEALGSWVYTDNSNRLHRTPLVSRRCSMYVQPKLQSDRRRALESHGNTYIQKEKESREYIRNIGHHWGRCTKAWQEQGADISNRQSVRRRRSCKRVCLQTRSGWLCLLSGLECDPHKASHAALAVCPYEESKADQFYSQRV